jgi:hypothetical protein
MGDVGASAELHVQNHPYYPLFSGRRVEEGTIALMWSGEDATTCEG